MSGLMGSLLGKRDPKQNATQAIIGLREQLAMIDKKEEHLDRQIEEETRNAKACLSENKADPAKAALRRRKALEASQDKLSGMRLTLEIQLDALESGLFNAQIMATLSNSQKALKQIQKDLNIDKVENVMEDLRRQVEDTEYVQQAMSMPLTDALHDEDEIMRELKQLKAEMLEERSDEREVAIPAPVRTPPRYTATPESEREEMRRLEASLAM